MRCYNCGRELTNVNQCIYCGSNVSMYRKALIISNALYNDGLERAKSRDLSGAIEILNTSLRYNKENVDARNLLGLIYFEVGQVVDAISEWVISKNISPENNLAEYYLKEIQSNPAKFDAVRQSIKKYNQSVLYCQQDSSDLAVIQLKKVVSANPKLVKAYQLLALLYFKDKEYEKTRRTLNKAFKINKTDPTTLRYMNELDQVYKHGTKNAGVASSTDNAAARVQKKLFAPKDRYNDNGNLNGLVNIIFGIVLGVLATVFLIVPAVKHGGTSSTSNSLVIANEQLADKNSEIDSLNSKIKSLEDENANLALEASRTTEVRESYMSLYKAMTMNQSDHVAVYELLEKVNGDILDNSAKEQYKSLKASAGAGAIAAFNGAAKSGLEGGRLDEAIKYYSYVVSIQEDYSGYTAMLALADAYKAKADGYSSAADTDKKNENMEKAKELYSKVSSKAAKDSEPAKKAKEALDNIEKSNSTTASSQAGQN